MMRDIIEKILNCDNPVIQKYISDIKTTSHNYSFKELRESHSELNLFVHMFNMCPMEWIKYKMNFGYISETVLFSLLVHDAGKPYCKMIDKKNRKLIFKGHEGVSVFIAADFYKHVFKDYMDAKQYQDFLQLIGNHNIPTVLIHSINNGNFEKARSVILDILERYPNNKQFVYELIKHGICDELGKMVTSNFNRYFLSNKKIEKLFRLLDEYEIEYDDMRQHENDKELILLVGPPLSGKTSYVIENHNKYKDYCYIKEIDAICDYYKKNINEISDYYKEDINIGPVVKIMLEKFRDKIKEGKNVIVERYFMSRSSRKTFINLARDFGYRIKIILFVTSFHELKERNKNQKTVEGIEKRISASLLTNIIKNFDFPTYDEADEIVIVK